MERDESERRRAGEKGGRLKQKGQKLREPAGGSRMTFRISAEFRLRLNFNVSLKCSIGSQLM